MTHTSEEKTTRTLLKNKITIITVAVIAVLLLLSLVWLYTGRVSSVKKSVFKTLPLPVAVIGSNLVTSADLYERVGLASELLTKNGLPTDNLESEILDQLIQTKKIESIARRNGVNATSSDLDNAFNGIVKQFPNQNEQELITELQNSYGLSLDTFKNEVLYQTVIQENLSLWFNNQESLNPEAYTTARGLLSKLDNGEDFAQVATNFSQDPASQAFAGDSGFVAYSELLPEFQTAVADFGLQENKIVASRYGIHILRLNAIEEVGEGDSKEKSYNLQQIFLAPNDFNRWLESETAKIQSFKLL